ncbi:hypothetical protein [Deinococcus ruber]|uniref:hypothetical protein n=1 Tax=Deinococcus ruber TaxID=1848197 RepID=UPI001667D3F1|nr:hypothetical protein [Deinococcus ruber]
MSSSLMTSLIKNFIPQFFMTMSLLGTLLYYVFNHTWPQIIPAAVSIILLQSIFTRCQLIVESMGFNDAGILTLTFGGITFVIAIISIPIFLMSTPLVQSFLVYLISTGLIDAYFIYIIFRKLGFGYRGKRKAGKRKIK